MWGASVGNAYFQALMKEKLYIVVGLKSEELQGHVLVMYKALYGTRSGGAHWHDKLFLTFFPRWVSNLQKQIVIFG